MVVSLPILLAALPIITVRETLGSREIEKTWLLVCSFQPGGIVELCPGRQSARTALSHFLPALSGCR